MKENTKDALKVILKSVCDHSMTKEDALTLIEVLVDEFQQRNNPMIWPIEYPRTPLDPPFGNTIVYYTTTDTSNQTTEPNNVKEKITITC